MKYTIWLSDWLENYVRPSTKARTYTRYVEIINQHIRRHLGEYDMDELSPIILQKFITQLLQSGNLKTGKGLSPNSVNAIITLIKNSLKTAYTVGYISECFTDKLKRPKQQEKQVNCFTFAEQKQIELYILNSHKPSLFGIILCLYTGLRLGELLALEWTDIDFAKHELHVTKTCYDGKNQNGVFTRITDTPKTLSSIRTIPLPKQLMPLLRKIKNKNHSKFVVPGNKNTIAIRSYQRMFSMLLDTLHIDHRGFHSLRHTFATRALECGMDIKTLSEILGHKSPAVTLNRYVHSLMEHKKELMNRLGKLL